MKYIGESFITVAQNCLENKMILIAIETKKHEQNHGKLGEAWGHDSVKNHFIIMNPQKDHNLQKEDHLFFISEQMPTKSELDKISLSISS